jgi:hypothetical protein
MCRSLVETQTITKLKMGSTGEFFYDPKALYKVTINGQLYLIMLIERLTLAGIDVFYSNTDGITAIVKNNQETDYKRICDEWQKELGLELEFFSIKKMVMRDVNNYILEYENGEVKAKGDFIQKPKLGKELDAPIVANAIYEYFFKGKTIGSTIRDPSKKPIYYLISRKIGDDFNAVLERIEELSSYPKQTTLPNICRYMATNYKSPKSGYLYKVRKSNKEREHVLKDSPVIICNNMSDFDITNINFQYYERRVMSFINLLNNKQQSLF